MTLRVSCPASEKTATNHPESFTTPKKPKIDPLTLTLRPRSRKSPTIRRLRFRAARFSVSPFLVEPTKRSEEIQTILKLDEIGQTERSIKRGAEQASSAARRSRPRKCNPSRDALQLHLQIATLLLRGSTGGRQQAAEGLGLARDHGIDCGHEARCRAFRTLTTVLTSTRNPPSRDLEGAYRGSKGFPELGKQEAAAIVADLMNCRADPALLAALQRRSFIEKGLELVRRPRMPLLRHAMEERAAPPRPPESQAGEVGGGPKASATPS